MGMKNLDDLFISHVQKGVQINTHVQKLLERCFIFACTGLTSASSSAMVVAKSTDGASAPLLQNHSTNNLPHQV